MDQLTHPTQQAHRIYRYLALSAASSLMVGAAAHLALQHLKQQRGNSVGLMRSLERARVLAPATVGLLVSCMLFLPVERVCSQVYMRQARSLFASWREREGNTPGADQAIDEIIKAYINQNTSLKLGSHGLTTLPDLLDELTQLQELVLDRNPLRTFPEKLCNLTALQSLRLGGCQIAFIPDEIDNLTELRELNLNDNPLSTFPEKLCNLTALQSLRLGGCQIALIPDEIENLTELRELNLNDNPLEEFPEKLCNLTTLQSLHVGGCQIKSLPPQIKNLTKLQELELGDDSLAAFPEELRHLTALRSLIIEVNKRVFTLSEIQSLNDLQLEELIIVSDSLVSLPMQLANARKKLLFIGAQDSLAQKQASAINEAQKRAAKGERLEDSQADLDRWKRYQGEEDLLSQLKLFSAVEQLAFSALLRTLNNDLTFEEGQRQIKEVLEERLSRRASLPKSAQKKSASNQVAPTE